MPGVTGREVTAAYGRTSTWGSPSSVTQQILLQSLDGFDVEPVFIDDDSFSQTWRGPSEISDTTPRSQELAMQARFEDMDVWYAAGVGASSAPIEATLFNDYAALSTATGSTATAASVNTYAYRHGISSINVLNAANAARDYVNATNTAARAAASPAQLTAHANALNTIGRVNSILVYSNSSVSAPSISSTVQPLAWRHQINMAPDLSHIMTLAANVDVPKIGATEGDSAYILQISALKLRGWMLRIGENGVIQASFPVIGNRADYPSATVTKSKDFPIDRAQIKNAPAARLGNRLLRKHMRFRMKGQTDAALAETDELTTVNGPVREISFDFTRPLAEDDFAVGSDYLIEPDDDGFAELPVEITFGRMHAKTANSLYTAMLANGVFKADAQWTGPLVNSTVRREMLITIPALQIVGWRAPITGQQQVRPIGMFKMRKSDVPLAEVPGFTKHDPDSPARIVLINGNHNHLSSTSNIFRVHDD